MPSELAVSPAPLAARGRVDLSPEPDAPPQRTRGWRAAATLAERELVRFFRQRNRVIGALGQPIIFWILFGSGLRSSFRPGGGGTATGAGVGASAALSYEEYFFPGVVVMIVLFTAIFATISIIEDRQKGFLQEVLIAPVPRGMVVLGKVLGGTILALIQAWLFLALAPFAGISLTIVSFVAASLILLVLGFALTSLGVSLAWKMDSTQGFHAMMTVFLMPLWLLSGAFFPADGAPTWLAWVIAANPLTYGVAALRRVLYLARPDALAGLALPGLPMSLLVTALFAAVAFAAAMRIAADNPGRRNSAT